MRLKQFLQVAALVALAGGVGPAYSAMWQWSKTSSNNATADPSINYSEGQSPSSLNDSARAAMARTAEYRDDISGALVTTGTSTAYLVTTNQGLAAIPTDGQLLAITPHATNGLNPSLAADGGTVYPIQTSPGVAVGAATLILGTPYTLKFSLANTSWILRDFYGNPFSVPLGAILPYVGATAPNSNFIIPIGQPLSRTTYATLFALCGTAFGAGDGTTTFNVPDMRGNAPVGLDAGLGRFTGLFMGTQTGAVSVTLGTTNLPPYTPSGSIANGAITISPNSNLQQSSGIVQIAGGGSFFSYNNVTPTASQAASTFTGNAQGGASTPFNNTQPTLGVNYILRVL